MNQAHITVWWYEPFRFRNNKMPWDSLMAFCYRYKLNSDINISTDVGIDGKLHG